MKYKYLHLHNPDFRFRELEITRILAQWDAGESVLLTGIRRTGKSEIMRAALYRYSQLEHSVGYLDVQAEDSLPQFYQNLLAILLSNLPVELGEQLWAAINSVQKLPNTLLNLVSQHIGRISIPDAVDIELRSPGDQIVRYWKPLTEQIAEVIIQHGRLNSPVIGIDELPFMLENLLEKEVSTTEIKVMLASLRTLRDAGLRLIIGGSISFENLLTLYNIPHTVLGGLFRLPVAPFDRPEAESYLQEMLAGHFAVDPEAVTLILNTLPDYVPEVLKITKGFIISCKDIEACEACLTNEVMPAVRRSFVQQFNERLGKNYIGEELECAEQILDVIAHGSIQGCQLNGLQLPHGYMRVLNLLQYDNFIVDAPDNSWRFSLNLIRIWWRNQRGMV
jgi:hypothetical protein